jgi:hypothetical protein
MDAGRASLSWAERDARLHLETVGLVAKLYRVRADYTVTFGDGFCADSSQMVAEEGRKRRETKVSYRRTPGKAEYVETDLLANKVVRVNQIDVPSCVHDILGGLAQLRQTGLEPGKEISLPISDGRKSADVRIVIQRREKVRTKAGEFQTVRAEAFLLNNVIYRRKGRLFVWLTDDQRRLPVQVRIQMPFYLGTVTLQLEKEDRS